MLLFSSNVRSHTLVAYSYSTIPVWTGVTHSPNGLTKWTLNPVLSFLQWQIQLIYYPEISPWPTFPVMCCQCIQYGHNLSFSMMINLGECSIASIIALEEITLLLQNFQWYRTRCVWQNIWHIAYQVRNYIWLQLYCCQFHIAIQRVNSFWNVNGVQVAR